MCPTPLQPKMPFARMPNFVQNTSLALIAGLTLLSMSLAQAQIPAAAKPAASQNKTEAKQDVVEIDEGDPAMQLAFKKAQASLDEFLKVHAANDPDSNSPTVRVKVTEGKTTEYVWLHPFKVNGKGFKGTVNSAPTLLKKISVGSTVSFQRKDIVDWTYYEMKARRMHGNFTTCAQLAKAPAAEVEALKKAYGLDCSKNR